MWKLIGLTLLQTLFLAGGQVLLKLALDKLGKFEWTWTYFKTVLVDWWLYASGISCSLALVLWIYILKKFPFNQAHPLTSLSFVFGMIAAWLIFGESVPFLRWIGLILIVAGCFLIMK
jgi:undecaprenyl phosphate-alpha-L-ara4N flippase subunit ArnE